MCSVTVSYCKSQLVAKINRKASYMPSCVHGYLSKLDFFAAFGWLQTTLRGEERYADYQVGLGYWKGSGSAVEVFVELVSGPELRESI